MVQSRRRLWVAGMLLVAVGLAAGAFLVTRGREVPRPPPRVTVAKPVVNQRFRSRPDLLPPVMKARGRASAPVLLAPKRGSGQSGPAILDAHGKLVWFHPVARGTTANDFRVQRYRGQPVLTWW